MCQNILNSLFLDFVNFNILLPEITLDSTSNLKKKFFLITIFNSLLSGNSPKTRITRLVNVDISNSHFTYHPSEMLHHFLFYLIIERPISLYHCQKRVISLKSFLLLLAETQEYWIFFHDFKEKCFQYELAIFISSLMIFWICLPIGCLAILVSQVLDVLSFLNLRMRKTTSEDARKH